MRSASTRVRPGTAADRETGGSHDTGRGTTVSSWRTAGSPALGAVGDVVVGGGPTASAADASVDPTTGSSIIMARPVATHASTDKTFVTEHPLELCERGRHAVRRPSATQGQSSGFPACLARHPGATQSGQIGWLTDSRG